MAILEDGGGNRGTTVSRAINTSKVGCDSSHSRWRLEEGHHCLREKKIWIPHLVRYIVFPRCLHPNKSTTIVSSNVG